MPDYGIIISVVLFYGFMEINSHLDIGELSHRLDCIDTCIDCKFLVCKEIRFVETAPQRVAMLCYKAVISCIQLDFLTDGVGV